ncbi:Lysine exporter protein (LYSE/YGGA) [Methanosphaerula palustris E1-9c]|uniref:Lysine exporter protein (LYSE/YGGA) n=1 Tax=Methanosphaerula palustris (strain ATCC BAA-1556 / DSM 19958 / E1-9c) TaxID=521011 RepID=B8GET8_METPE|nr:Lysine exporter protein (LYSE/YGGA) [Methanosphaerula palustris E1-9c]
MMPQSLVGIILFSFLIGLTGALAPGPTLVATITASMKGGWTAGPKVTLGHIAIEALVALLILAGVATVVQRYTSLIAAVGGCALIGFGLLTLRGVSSASLNQSGAVTTQGPILAGMLTSVANPYFWIWWLSIGSGFLVDSIGIGALAVAAFMAGHWAADLGWFTAVSTGVHRGGEILPEPAYRMILQGCGVLLILFGGYYLSTLLSVT